jgi:hypothetical protein
VRINKNKRQEQLSSRCQQRVVATVEESVLRTEMAGLESQEENVLKRVLFYKPMAWLITSHQRISKKGCLYKLLSPQLCLSQKSEVFRFRFVFLHNWCFE